MKISRQRWKNNSCNVKLVYSTGTGSATENCNYDVWTGNRHANEIARLALSFIKRMRQFREESTKFPNVYPRIGIHSGNTVGGVVGTKMPRFCLFGETINIASRMETTGDPERIQISADTKFILDLTEAGSYITKPRGSVSIKVVILFVIQNNIIYYYFIIGKRNGRNILAEWQKKN